ncbi:MAG: hypothetical protein HOU81_01240 [Hamadaea sp.]|uniref:hypothetical protein n=1 Tax=Hamadaea sp. TaxID=2024425 RepID=UPI001856C628|nr:hypothetical protein [Hamadaea sp.]NUR69422.1 hypothetical protein [Hamadaea sp.]NUT23837.1 hypothetical protein [Hamadaea sp.]
MASDAQQVVIAYHEAQLAMLAEMVAAATDRYRAGEIDVFALDEIIHQYHEAARKLWVFCWGPGGNRAARDIERMAAEGEAIDWWSRGEFRRQR